MMHHREKKKNNIYISSGAFWCIGALRCIWCICTTMPLVAFSQPQEAFSTPTSHIDLKPEISTIWMKERPLKPNFKTRLHNDLITTLIDVSELRPVSNIRICYTHDIATDSLDQLIAVPAADAITFRADHNGYYITYGTSKSNQDTIVAIYQVINSEVIVYKPHQIKSKN